MGGHKKHKADMNNKESIMLKEREMGGSKVIGGKMRWNVKGRRQEGGKHRINFSEGIRKERGADCSLQLYSVLTRLIAVNEWISAEWISEELNW